MLSRGTTFVRISWADPDPRFPGTQSEHTPRCNCMLAPSAIAQRERWLATNLGESATAL
jgi:hypothetical protein